MPTSAYNIKSEPKKFIAELFFSLNYKKLLGEIVPQTKIEHVL